MATSKPTPFLKSLAAARSLRVSLLLSAGRILKESLFRKGSRDTKSSSLPCYCTATYCHIRPVIPVQIIGAGLAFIYALDSLGFPLLSHFQKPAHISII